MPYFLWESVLESNGPRCLEKFDTIEEIIRWHLDNNDMLLKDQCFPYYDVNENFLVNQKFQGWRVIYSDCFFQVEELEDEEGSFYPFCHFNVSNDLKFFRWIVKKEIDN